MVLDLIFATILLLMVALGAWRGAVVSGSGLFGIVCGYLGAIFAATTAADWVGQTLVVSPLLAPAVAGTLGFVLTWLIVSSLTGVLVAWDAARVEGFGRGALDRAFGGFFGLARGGLIVVLLAILTSWLDAARDLGAIDGLAALPDTEKSTLAAVSGRLVESAVAQAMSEAGPAGEIVARLTARPGQSLGSVQSILEDERLTALFSDSLFWTLIQNDSVDYAMNRSSVRAIVQDPEMRGRFADLGLVEDAARESPRVFRDTMAGVLAEIAPRVQHLRQDPELARLARDPEIVALIESGNTLALINHPAMKRLVERATADL
jgi:membrane protein required for colicin V production